MLFLPTQLLASLLALAPAQSPLAFPGDEGPLDNDSYLPTAREAEQRLATGDQALLRLREAARGSGASGEPARLRTEMLEAWHGALAVSVTGDSVAPRPRGPRADARSPWEDLDGTADRRTEGVEVAVLRRLTSLDRDDREAWVERFSALAREQLSSAGTAPELLGEVERRHPATAAAARAGLLRGERALEAGRLIAARTWFERALVHVRLGALAEPGLAAGLDRRLDTVARLLPPAPIPGSWSTARGLQPLHQVALADTNRHAPTAPELGLGVRPGMCFLDGGLAVVQAAERVFLFDETSGHRVADFQPNGLIGDTWTTAPLRAPRSEPPGWPLLPATDGEHLLLVQGRLEGKAANLLLCATIEDRRGPAGVDTGGPVFPRLEWALWENRRMDAAGRREASGLDLPAGAEFQPGPLVLGSQVLCQVRERPGGDEELGAGLGFQTDGDIRSWLVALDLGSGRVLWKRFLAKGVELGEGLGRFTLRLPGVSSAQPLASHDGRVFAGTHTGAGVLLDVADGRVLWSFQNRRRPASERGWSGAPPRMNAAGLLWAPADGDHAYWLRGDADLAGTGLFRHAPVSIGEGLALVDAGAASAGDAAGEERALVLSRAGREFTLSRWEALTGGRIDSPYLGPGESFTGAGRASSERAFFATQTGLYIADRQRELFLIDYAPLTTNGAHVRPGGSVFAHGARLYVVGPQMLWIFEVR